MKHLTIIIIIFFSFNLAAIEIPKSTENAGMNKYERINKIEKDLINIAREFKSLKLELSILKHKIKEEVLEELNKKK